MCHWRPRMDDSCSISVSMNCFPTFHGQANRSARTHGANAPPFCPLFLRPTWLPAYPCIIVLQQRDRGTQHARSDAYKMHEINPAPSSICHEKRHTTRSCTHCLFASTSTCASRSSSSHSMCFSVSRVSACTTTSTSRPTTKKRQVKK